MRMLAVVNTILLFRVYILFRSGNQRNLLGFLQCIHAAGGAWYSCRLAASAARVELSTCCQGSQKHWQRPRPAEFHKVYRCQLMSPLMSVLGRGDPPLSEHAVQPAAPASPAACESACHGGHGGNCRLPAASLGLQQLHRLLLLL